MSLNLVKSYDAIKIKCRHISLKINKLISFGAIRKGKCIEFLTNSPANNHKRLTDFG